MAEYSTTTAVAEDDKEVAVISDSEGEDEDDDIEIFDDGSPHLPPEVWAAVINCEYCYIYY